MNLKTNKQSENAWQCEVCGYIHRGPTPPDQCPICGVPKDQFQPYIDPAGIAVKPKPSRWSCLVCSYQHTGDSPPDICPVCGVLKDMFEAVEEDKNNEKTDSIAPGKIVVVGSGIAGLSAVEAIRKISETIDITVLSKETHLPYYRLNLTRYIAGELNEDALTYYPAEWYEKNSVNFIPNVEVSTIETTEKNISLTDGRSYPYDKLILTAGAHSFIPPIEGVELKGVTTLRNISDANFILKESETAKSIVIVGGGILGLEIAGALSKRAKSPLLLERFKWIMPRQLNQTAAQLLKKHIKIMGIGLKESTSVKKILGKEHVTGVLLNNDETLAADLVIISAGIRTNSYIARKAGLQVNRGIIVNDRLEASLPNIFAAGDIAEHRGDVSGLWNTAQYQGNIAGMNAAGQIAEFAGIPRSNTIKVLGIDLLSIGKFEAQDGSDIIIEDQHGNDYRRFVFRDSYLVGAILYGNTAIGGGIKKAIENKTGFSGLLKNQPTAADIWDYFI
jgi:NAD(P)H-nitrite reductase large subunit/rubredoxin